MHNGRIPERDEVIFKVIYDNYPAYDSFIGDWGFSCLIETAEKTILFVTGTRPEILKHNIDAMSINTNTIDLIVISHNHGDHTGGLLLIIEGMKDIPEVYVPASGKKDFLIQFPELSDHTNGVTVATSLFPGGYLTGEMGSRISEHSLVV